MSISEKTVELNLTTELINWFSGLRGHPCYALAPCQRQEGVLAFDTSVHLPGGALLIQYKRAYVRGNIWAWRLNRTRLQDQHARLLFIESLGLPVVYAFPQFHLPCEIMSFRRRLLIHTHWFRPSQFSLPGGPVGHHSVEFDLASNAWRVHSLSAPIDLAPLSLDELTKEIDQAAAEENLSRLLNAVNYATRTGHEPSTSNQAAQFRPDRSWLRSLSVFVASTVPD